MSTLTKQEREGLEDIFLSIHTGGNKFTKFKEFSSLLVSKDIGIMTSKIIKMAKSGLKVSIFHKFILNFIKKKRNLSK